MNTDNKMSSSYLDIDYVIAMLDGLYTESDIKKRMESFHFNINDESTLDKIIKEILENNISNGGLLKNYSLIDTLLEPDGIKKISEILSGFISDTNLKINNIIEEGNDGSKEFIENNIGMYLKKHISRLKATKSLTANDFIALKKILNDNKYYQGMEILNKFGELNNNPIDRFALNYLLELKKSFYIYKENGLEKEDIKNMINNMSKIINEIFTNFNEDFKVYFFQAINSIFDKIEEDFNTSIKSINTDKKINNDEKKDFFVKENELYSKFKINKENFSDKIEKRFFKNGILKDTYLENNLTGKKYFITNEGNIVESDAPISCYHSQNLYEISFNKRLGDISLKIRKNKFSGPIDYYSIDYKLGDNLEVLKEENIHK